MEYKENDAEVLKLLNRQMKGDRTGLHLSDLIYCLRKAYYRKKGLAVAPTREQQLLWITGYAFQNYLYPGEPEVIMVKDGIQCTPDVRSGIEVKSTRLGMNRFKVEEQKTWLKQIKGYAKVLNTTKYGLTVLFVCGNYKPPFPDLKHFDLEFTQQELDDNWAEMLERKAELMKGGVPDKKYREDWECDRCELVEQCKDVLEAQEALLKRKGK